MPENGNMVDGRAEEQVKEQEATMKLAAVVLPNYLLGQSEEPLSPEPRW